METEGKGFLAFGKFNCLSGFLLIYQRRKDKYYVNNHFRVKLIPLNSVEIYK